jgi:hypothetical protein
MDAAAWTSLIMSIITPFVPLIGTTVVTKLSEDVYGTAKEQAQRLYEAIHKRFSHEKDGGNASQALQAFADGDTDYEIVVEKKLFTILQADPNFARELAQIVQSGPRQILTAAEEARASRIRMNNSLGRGHQEISAGKSSIIDDVQFNIGNEKP